VCNPADVPQLVLFNEGFTVFGQRTIADQQKLYLFAALLNAPGKLQEQ